MEGNIEIHTLPPPISIPHIGAYSLAKRSEIASAGLPRQRGGPVPPMYRSRLARPARRSRSRSGQYGHSSPASRTKTWIFSATWPHPHGHTFFVSFRTMPDASVVVTVLVFGCELRKNLP